MKSHRVLVVDDQKEVIRFVKIALEPHGFEVAGATSGEEALAVLAGDGYAAVLLDVRLPGINGLEALKRLREMGVQTPVIVMTSFGTSQVVIEAMKQGAFDYLPKPFSIEQVRGLIQRAVERAAATTVRADLPMEFPRFEETSIVGTSPQMLEVLKRIGRVAATNATVLIQGESGTGKELVAKALHRNSLRKDTPFLVVNCAAIPETLLESELFGHERGAFTGAVARRIGRFEQGHLGTIFLDEIGDMSLALQSKILRVLEERTFERVGGNETLRVDVRIIAATNKDLKALVEQRSFREDLYYRLAVVTIHLPSLRERVEDIPLLMSHFIRRYSLENGKALSGASKEVVETLLRYPWPGNVRELENAIQFGVIMAKGQVITRDDLPPDLREALAEGAALPPPPVQGTLEEVEGEHIRRVLAETGGNISRAAARLGIHRNTLRRKLRQLEESSSD